MILQMRSMVSRDVMSFLKLMLSVVPHSQTDELGLCLIQNLGTRGMLGRRADLLHHVTNIKDRAKVLPTSTPGKDVDLSKKGKNEASYSSTGIGKLEPN